MGDFADRLHYSALHQTEVRPAPRQVDRTKQMVQASATQTVESHAQMQPFAQILKQADETARARVQDSAQSQTKQLNNWGTVQFSTHASARLRMRGIQTTPQLVHSLTDAMNQLEGKSAKDSLVVIGDVGFVVSVPNRTVITAMAMGEEGMQLYTNIDSAVWMKSPPAQ